MTKWMERTFWHFAKDFHYFYDKSWKLLANTCLNLRILSQSRIEPKRMLVKSYLHGLSKRHKYKSWYITWNEWTRPPGYAYIASSMQNEHFT